MRKPEWSLVQYFQSNASVRLGVASPQGVHRLPEGWPLTAMDLLERWRDWEGQLRALDIGALPLLKGIELAAPLTFPRKVIGAGANYSDHIEEMGGAVPEVPVEPFFFLKAPSTSVVGHGMEVSFPAGAAPRLDFEAELGVVIADRCRGVSEADAMDHVAGYVVANDLSARGYFRRHDAPDSAFAWDWFSHKSFDGSSPMGPGIVPSWMVEHPEDLRITLAVNGVTKQDSSTSNLIAGIARLIASASRTVTLEPGDVILTGTPAGVGMPREDFLSPGDVITVEIDGVGRLENRISRS